MNEMTVVYFKGLERGYSVSGVLAEFNLSGNPVTIRWYGIIVAAAFLLALLFGGRMALKWRMNPDKLTDVLIYGTLGGTVGARLYYLITHWAEYQENFGAAFRIWEGGLSLYGGLIGAALAVVLVCRIRKLNLLNLLDIAGMSLLLGQGLGSWGGYTNQDAFGSNTKLPWGMISEKTTAYLYANQSQFIGKGLEVDPFSYVHPTFLYQFFWCLLGFFVLYLITKNFRKFSGQTALCFGIWYSLGSMFFSNLRAESLYLGPVRVSLLVSFLLAAACAALLLFRLQECQKNPKPIEGIDFFPGAPSSPKEEEAPAAEEAPDTATADEGTPDTEETETK